jgi:uncharacterized membrane protein
MGRALPLDWRRRSGLTGPATKGISIALCTLLLLTPLLALSAMTPAKADFRVCNRTKYLLNLAVGYLEGEEFSTEGWWSVTPNSCATPIKRPLSGRYVYLYATDVDAADVLQGTVSMCIGRRKFKIEGITDCWRRGLQAVNFEEIDTLSATDWTVFLNDSSQ